MIDLLGQQIETGKVYVYLKNARTGSSTVRKLKMIGKCILVGKVVKFSRLWDEEGYNPKRRQNDKPDTVYDPKDIICLWEPTAEQWAVELTGMTMPESKERKPLIEWTVRELIQECRDHMNCTGCVLDGTGLCGQFGAPPCEWEVDGD